MHSRCVSALGNIGRNGEALTGSYQQQAVHSNKPGSKMSLKKNKKKTLANLCYTSQLWLRSDHKPLVTCPSVPGRACVIWAEWELGCSAGQHSSWGIWGSSQTGMGYAVSDLHKQIPHYQERNPRPSFPPVVISPRLPSAQPIFGRPALTQSQRNQSF